ncbi:hypothetical protein GCG54_00010530 [Colletotrichum gloeosporioides]|uniref:Uncharacterized protein n=1 Tax=Colletotrichum gloeosporioides TaxID=474922 RepID=A0A8H4FEM3_COLGL|nr:uncharacterized protein GCG54_00010530 [Colletotrichum gloeosporioides]KAF3798184.1 hypothetical protein GCG54_00010530 [Colletotrichum gloeosporioides]
MNGEDWLFHGVPQELRNNIFSHLFASTRLSHGKRYVDKLKRIRIKPAPNALAILRTCRAAYNSIGDTWIGHVLFHFEDSETMLDMLLSAPPGTIPKIRHMRVVGDPLQLAVDYPRRNDLCVFYQLASVLKLLPNLCLETLTVLGTRSPPISYSTLTGLISISYGWKELRYISHSSALLGYGPFGAMAREPASRLDLVAHMDEAVPFGHVFHDESIMDRYLRWPQPYTWQKLLNDRDDAATVTIYRSTVSGKACNVLDTSTRAPISQDTGLPGNFGVQRQFMNGGEKRKEIMVIVERRREEDHRHSESLSLSGNDIRQSDIQEDFGSKSWTHIRKWGLEEPANSLLRIRARINDPDVHEIREEDNDEPVEIEVDAYDDVDHYIWPPKHFTTPPKSKRWRPMSDMMYYAMGGAHTLEEAEQW